MKKILQTTLFIILKVLFPKLTLGGSILVYHSVGDNDAFFTVASNKFKSQMEQIKKKGLRVVLLSELIDAYYANKDLVGCVSITFDDGYIDNLTTVLPILRSYGYKASVFVIPGRMGEANVTSDGFTLPLFSLSDFHRYGAYDTFELLPHTMNHPDLSVLSPNEQETEIQAAYEALSDTHKVLAYPWGQYSQETLALLKKNKWKAACTVVPGLVKKNTNPYLFPRNPVDSLTLPNTLGVYLSDGIEWYSQIRSFI
ncbi:MAG: polysaccharide deacetylase family protein [Candidatus Vogelbacteria bacterium]